MGMEEITPWEKKMMKNTQCRLRTMNVKQMPSEKAAKLNQERIRAGLLRDPHGMKTDWNRKLDRSPRKLSQFEKQFHFDNEPFESSQSEFETEIAKFLEGGGSIKRQPNEVPIDPMDYLNGINVDAGDLCV